jgi:hypothetical protein
MTILLGFLSRSISLHQHWRPSLRSIISLEDFAALRHCRRSVAQQRKFRLGNSERHRCRAQQHTSDDSGQKRPSGQGGGDDWDGWEDWGEQSPDWGAEQGDRAQDADRPVPPRPPFSWPLGRRNPRPARGTSRFNVPRDEYLRPMIDARGIEQRLNWEESEAEAEVRAEFIINQNESRQAVKYAGKKIPSPLPPSCPTTTASPSLSPSGSTVCLAPLREQGTRTLCQHSQPFFRLSGLNAS